MLRKADVSTAPIGPEAMAEPTRLQDKMTDAARAAWVDAARDILIAGGIAALNLRGLAASTQRSSVSSVKTPSGPAPSRAGSVLLPPVAFLLVVFVFDRRLRQISAAVTP